MTNKEFAYDLFDSISIGKENRVQRHPNEDIDRMFRKLVKAANEGGDIIINVGDGYYRPILDKNDEGEYKRPVEVLDYKTYLAEERSRLYSLHKKYMVLKREFEKRTSEQLCIFDVLCV